MGKSSEFDFALSVLQQEVAASDLLTKAYARYLPLLGDGLRFILERLSATRLRAIFEEQFRLPADTPTGMRVAALAIHVPVLQKLGQVVSRDRRLDPDFRKRLHPLESLPPRLTREEIERLVTAAMPDWKNQGITLGNEPLAEGSVAVVMPFTWRALRRRSDSGRQGVFKLLKPGIKAMLDEDLEVLGQLGEFLDQECARYHLPYLDYEEKFSTIRDLLMREVELELEQTHLQEARRMYASNPKILIPEVFPFSSAKLTAMERVNGRKLDEGAVSEREGLARTVAEALIIQPLFSAWDGALFHADPHAGNLMAVSDGRLAILDWSLTGRLSRKDRVRLAQLFLAAVKLDLDGAERLITELTCQPPDQPEIRRVIANSLRALRWGKRPGLAWLMSLFDNLVYQANAKFGSDLLLYRKSLLTLEGALADLNDGQGTNLGAVFDKAIVTQFIRHWIAEWPKRLVSPLNFRPPATHVALSDVLAVIWESPVTATRWWMANSLDLLQAFAD